MRTEVMLFVQDVESSSKWYQQLLEAKSGHGGSEYEMIVDDEGSLLFQLHHLDGDEHNVNVTASTSRGDGVLTYVHVDDVNRIHERAKTMNANVLTNPNYIELAGHTEFIIRDPDGYSLAIYSNGKV
ncbi:MAG: hypothetical protein QGI68_02105 [Pseudomonadales bacterium]|jgi:catechol 2,3-dioxygenase-like lactoylglutathione lyase family enzyme|nr:hypothetical protein [Pseudomonadales bacterium]MDP7360589.1 hypothetical protein [Pseudomonadales bacterium]MDP7594345.1 hypothetical protein [Pseudomonadales bacterium]|tara:strand:- start:418 stop:798 length:381 start_codon:yes stop_codon:yes gene_type:complete